METCPDRSNPTPGPRKRSHPPNGVLSGKAFVSIVTALVLATGSLILGAPFAHAATSEWIFDSAGTTPPTDLDAASVELGVRFTPKTSGTIDAIRFYRPRESSGPFTARLWDDRGRVLSTIRFQSLTSHGWQTARLSNRVAVSAGRQYTASYSAPSGRYAASQNYFSSATETRYLRIPRGAGVYKYSTGSYPSESYQNSNYYVDVQFTPRTSPAPTTSPTPTTGPTPTTSPTAGPTPTSNPTSTVAPPGGALDLPMERWHGGPAYYSKFPKAAAAGWTNPSFFPISVFFGKPGHAAALKSVGINTYMGAEHDGSAMSTITREGISVLAQAEWTPAEVGNDSRVVGWHISDECDMGLSGCDQGNGEYGSLEVQRRYANERRALNDGRLLHANFGNGVLGTYWSPNTMDDHISLVDSSSVDKYAYTSPHVRSLLPQSPHWPTGKNPATASAYGWLQDRMETFAAPAGSKPNWVFVETAKPYLTETGSTTITGDQIEGAVWNAIINGASGIAYFQHNNNNQCGNYSLVECSQTLRDKVRQINASITSLAPVLNTRSYTWDFGPSLDTALKTHGGFAYIFAMTDGGTGSRSFKLPPGIKGSQVEVVGEGRALTVSERSFTDSFTAEHDHRIYRVRLN